MNRKGLKETTPRHRRPISARLFPALCRALDARGWTLADLARASGLPYARVVSATTGYRLPSAETQERTARALGVSIPELWSEGVGRD